MPDAPAPYHGLYAYPWDVAELPADKFVADILARGLDTLCLATSYHAGKFLRPHGKSGHVFFPEDGTVHCQVRPERYGRILPRASGVAAAGDAFGAYAARRDIAVTAWTVLLHNTRIGAEFPDIVAKNAFGDPYIYSLCPAHPDVQDYAVSLCADIADRYPLRGLTLETPGWMPYRHGFHHEFSLVGANPWLDFSLGLCFCDHCLTRASHSGIDANGLRGRIATAIETYLAAPRDTPENIGQHWIAADLVAESDLTAFVRWRRGVVTELVARIRGEIRADAELFVIPSVQRPCAHAWIEGSDLPALARAADGLELCLYDPAPEAIAADFDEVRRRVGDRKLRCILRPGPPDATDAANVAHKVADLIHAGANGIAFYNFGHLRRVHLDWIGGALHAVSLGKGIS